MIFFTVYVVDLNFSFEGATAGNSIKCLHNSFLQKEVKDKRLQHFFEKKSESDRRGIDCIIKRKNLDRTKQRYSNNPIGDRNIFIQPYAVKQRVRV